MPHQEQQTHGASQDTKAQRPPATKARAHHGGQERACNPGKLRQGQTAGDLLFIQSAGDADDEKIGPHHTLRNEVRQHCEERHPLQ